MCVSLCVSSGPSRWGMRAPKVPQNDVENPAVAGLSREIGGSSERSQSRRATELRHAPWLCRGFLGQQRYGGSIDGSNRRLRSA